jgi:hypothetical protein
MHVTYGRERSKTACRATADISLEPGTTRAGRRSRRAPCSLHKNCRRPGAVRDCSCQIRRHPQMFPRGPAAEVLANNRNPPGNDSG